MSIYIFCSACKTSFKVKDEYAGKKGICPKCGQVIDIAAPGAETQRGIPRPPTKAQIQEAQRLGIEFDERITYVELKQKIQDALANKSRPPVEQ